LALVCGEELMKCTSAFKDLSGSIQVSVANYFKAVR
jgi:hypothetical protein